MPRYCAAGRSDTAEIGKTTVNQPKRLNQRRDRRTPWWRTHTISVMRRCLPDYGQPFHGARFERQQARVEIGWFGNADQGDGRSVKGLDGIQRGYQCGNSVIITMCMCQEVGRSGAVGLRHPLSSPQARNHPTIRVEQRVAVGDQ